MRQNNLTKIVGRITKPDHMIANKKQSLAYLKERFQRGLNQTTTNHKNRLESAQRLLESYSYERVLDRGFSVIYDKNNNIISSGVQLENNQEIEIEFAKDDKIGANIKK